MNRVNFRDWVLQILRTIRIVTTPIVNGASIPQNTSLAASGKKKREISPQQLRQRTMMDPMIFTASKLPWPTRRILQ